jgi:uncharacterized protein YjbJ (UPF0337 family)
VGDDMDQAKGRVKEAAGDLTGDRELQREGKADQAAGRIKEKAAEAADKVGEAVDKVRDGVQRR